MNQKTTRYIKGYSRIKVRFFNLEYINTQRVGECVRLLIADKID